MTASDYDTPWKQALESYFEDFLAFFFPQAHQDIAWEQGYETLDKELQEIVRDAKTGKRFADQLVKVFLTDGEEKWLLIHIEVQSQSQADFAKRMYIYHHRIFDRYNQKVVSMAVLADERESWRPQEFGYSLWGMTSYLRFPIIKLLDYQPRWSELEASNNPFAFVVMAHLKTKATTKKPQERFRGKITLAKMLYQGGYTEIQVGDLFRFLDWIMVLPEELEDNYEEQIDLYEEERKMPYLSRRERVSEQKGRREGALENAYQTLVTIIETKFTTTVIQSQDKFEQVCRKLKSIQDLATFNQLLKKAILASSWEEFEQLQEIKNLEETSTNEVLERLKNTRECWLRDQ